MFFSKNFFAGLVLATSALAVPLDLPISLPLTLPPSLGPFKLFQELKGLPLNWQSQGAVKNDPKLKVQIGLKQSNVQGLQKKLEDISNPSSSNYGNWLSQAEIDSYVRPSDVSVLLVKSWLSLFGIKDVQQPTSDWIEFTAPVSMVESLLNTKYELFSHPQAGTIPRTKQYSLPLLLHDIVDLVTPTTAFYHNLAPHVEAAASNTTATHSKRQSCNTNQITPACINSLYGVDYTSTGSQTVGTTQFIQLAASHSDYSTFSSYYTSGLRDFRDVSVANGYNPGSGDQNTLLEGNLDTQFAAGVAAPNPSVFLAIGPSGQDFGDQVANFASYLTSASNPPSSVSTSYGGEEQYFDSNYLDRVCNEFMKAGARGISVFFSSGDHGVGGNGEDSCSQGFYALWPAACPYITSVGGTQFTNGREVVAQFPSISGSPGGGFSWHFSRPSYQDAAVTGYVNAMGGGNGYFNANGRGFPDIALVAKNYQVVVNGQVLSVLGTSASSPAWAGLVSVLNDYRRSKGKANLGFINPLLYQSASKGVFNDITSGSNTGCGTSGFYAAQGWDPASGLGSLKFSKFRAII